MKTPEFLENSNPTPQFKLNSFSDCNFTITPLFFNLIALFLLLYFSPKIFTFKLFSTFYNCKKVFPYS
jgi:hypothetical protein